MKSNSLFHVHNIWVSKVELTRFSPKKLSHFQNLLAKEEARLLFFSLSFSFFLSLVKITLMVVSLFIRSLLGVCSLGAYLFFRNKVWNTSFSCLFKGHDQRKFKTLTTTRFLNLIRMQVINWNPELAQLECVLLKKLLVSGT